MCVNNCFDYDLGTEIRITLKAYADLPLQKCQSVHIRSSKIVHFGGFYTGREQFLKSERKQRAI